MSQFGEMKIAHLGEVRLCAGVSWASLLQARQSALAPCSEEVTHECLGLEGKLPASTASMRARVPLPPIDPRSAPHRVRARTSPRSRVQACHPRSSGRLAPEPDVPTHPVSQLSLSLSDLAWAQNCTLPTVTRVQLGGRLPRRLGVWSKRLPNRLGAPRAGRSHLLATTTNESLAW